MLLVVLGVVFSIPSIFLIHQIFTRYTSLKTPINTDSNDLRKEEKKEDSSSKLQPDALQAVLSTMREDPQIFKKPKIYRHHLNYFSGKAFVKWLKSKHMVSSEEDAIQIGNILLERKLIVPDNSDSVFESKKYAMYKFVNEEKTGNREYDDLVDTVVFVHGMWSSDTIWSNFRKAFEEKGYKVYTPLWKNLASTTKDDENSSILDYAEKLDQYLVELGCIPFARRVTLVGHDSGALIVKLLASKGYASSTILISPIPSHGINLGPLCSKINLFKHKNPSVPKYEKARKMILNAFSESEARELYAQMEISSMTLGYEKYLSKSFDIPASNLPCPLLIVGGKEDKLCSPAIQNKIADKYKHAENRIYPGHSHYIILENDDSGNRAGWSGVASDILSWIAANKESRTHIMSTLKQRHSALFANITKDGKPDVLSIEQK